MSHTCYFYRIWWTPTYSSKISFYIDSVSHSLCLRSYDKLTIGCTMIKGPNNVNIGTWKVTFNSSDIDFIHYHFHRRVYKNIEIRIHIVFWIHPCINPWWHFMTHCIASVCWYPGRTLWECISLWLYWWLQNVFNAFLVQKNVYHCLSEPNFIYLNCLVPCFNHSFG